MSVHISQKTKKVVKFHPKLIHLLVTIAPNGDTRYSFNIGKDYRGYRHR